MLKVKRSMSWKLVKKSCFPLPINYKENNRGETAMAIREDLKQQISIRGTKSPFGMIAFNALTEIERLDALAREYNELIRHMDAGGDFFTFQASKEHK